MKTIVRFDATALARLAAEAITSAARRAVAERGVFTIAFSGGSTPGPMLHALARSPLPWNRVEVFQVDERIAPDGHPDRNLEELRAQLLAVKGPRAAQLHPIPVTSASPEDVAVRYAAELRDICGDPPVLDLVHLGLGADGHTASLLPGDADVTDAEVTATGQYQGRGRITLTQPALRRARTQLWLVTGAEKASAFRQLMAGSAQIPAGRVVTDDALVFADADAMGRPHR